MIHRLILLAFVALLAVTGCKADPCPPPPPCTSAQPPPDPGWVAARPALASNFNPPSWASTVVTTSWDGGLVDAGDAGPFVPVPGSYVSIESVNDANVGVSVTGTMTGTTLTFESTFDGTTWFSAYAVPFGGGNKVTSVTSTGQWVILGSGARQVRVRCSVLGDAGSPLVAISGQNGASVTMVLVEDGG